MQYLITDQNNDPVLFAVVYSSDANGAPAGSFNAQSDAYGYVEIPSTIGSAYLSVSFQKNIKVFVHADITNPLVMNIQDNLLNDVVISAGTTPDESSFDWAQVLTWLLIVSTFITICIGIGHAIKYFKRKKAAA